MVKFFKIQFTGTRIFIKGGFYDLISKDTKEVIAREAKNIHETINIIIDMYAYLKASIEPFDEKFNVKVYKQYTGFEKECLLSSFDNKCDMVDVLYHIENYAIKPESNETLIIKGESDIPRVSSQKDIMIEPINGEYTWKICDVDLGESVWRVIASGREHTRELAEESAVRALESIGAY